MEQGRVYSHFYSHKNLIIPKKEILRYMSCKSQDDAANSLCDLCLPSVTSNLALKGSFVYLPVECSNNEVYIADTCIKSTALAKNLKDCQSAVVFALTCGLNVDLLIKKQSAKSTSEAFCINAIATAAIEEYANEFCSEISTELKKESLCTRPRFSPGYGDLAIQNQSLFLNLTNASKLLGITITQNYMMMPSKSVTAIMGVSNKACNPQNSKCSICTQKQCKFKGED